MKQILTLKLCMLFAISLIAQDDTKKIIPGINGPAGNYIYLVTLDDLSEGRVARDDKFIVERIEKKTADQLTKEKDAKTIGECKTVKNYKELQKYFSESDLEELMSQYGNISKSQLVQKFTQYESLDSIAFLYGFIETRLALGHVYLDEKTTDGYHYIYRVTKVSNSGKKTPWGYSYIKGGMGNYTLPYLKPQWVDASGKDSLVKIRWTLPLDEEKVKSIPLGNEVAEENYNSLLHNIPFSPTNLMAKVMTRSNETFVEKALITPTYSADGDSLYFDYFETSVGEEYLRSYIIPQDEVYNEGIPSDTAMVFAEDSTTIDIIYNIDVKDTLNGIHISWQQLPPRSYYTGIEITRYDSDDLLDTVAILAPNTTSYMDRKIAVGHYYRYHVKALFVPQAGMVQRLAAQGTGSYSKFTKPLPPVNLAGQPVGNYIQLDWEAVDEPSIYGYYIYRGTSSKNLSLAAGPIFEKTFVDSLSSLSGRTHYNYAVASQNYRQDTSQYSNIISVRPTKLIEMVSPPSVNIYYANGTMRLNWRDVRADDNIIDSYILQRKRDDEPDYQTIHTTDLKKPSYTDPDVVQGSTYYYRVAAKSIYGDLTPYSEGAVYQVAYDKVPTINKFYARNITEGIKVSIPNMTAASRKSFNIYRRTDDSETFTKVKTIPADTFEYIDTAVQKDIYYVYVITLTDTNDREGSRGASVTVKRK